ncbi:MAG: DUF4870 domain-containing protein [Bacteroidota bacterium]
MKYDNQFLMLTHISQLAGLILPSLGGIIIPIVIWMSKKDEIYDLDRHGKDIINFQLSMLLWGIISFLLFFIFIGYILLVIIGLISVIYPIVNAIKVNDGRPYHYPLTIKFLN